MSVFSASIDFVFGNQLSVKATSLAAILAIAGFCGGQEVGSTPGQLQKKTEPNSIAQNYQVAEQGAKSNKPVKELTLTGRYHLITGTQRGVLILKAQIPAGSYIYSVTQEGSPPPSKITVTDSDQYRIKGKFSSDRNPKVIKFDPIFESRLEKHLELVQFFVPIELKPGSDPAKIQPEILFDGQVCSDAGLCMPIRGQKIKAKFAGYYEEQALKQPTSKTRRR